MNVGHPFLVQGNWTRSSKWNTLVDPLNGEPFIKVAEIDEGGVQVCNYSVYISTMAFCIIPKDFLFCKVFYFAYLFTLSRFHSIVHMHKIEIRNIYFTTCLLTDRSICSHLWRACPSVQNMVYIIRSKHQRGMCYSVLSCCLLFILKMKNMGCCAVIVWYYFILIVCYKKRSGLWC